MKRDSKIIFFDMGNTLLHFHFGKTDTEKDRLGVHYLTNYLKRYKQDIREEDVKERFFDTWISGIRGRRIKYVEYPVEDYLNGFLKDYGISLSLTECITAMDEFYAEYRKNVWWEADLPKILSEIRKRGYKIGVISNSRLYDEVMINCFKEAGLSKYIDTFTFSYYLRIAKPRHEIFKAALAKMSAEKSNIIMVGDSLESDIKPAVELGWGGIWFNRTNLVNKTEITPTAEINSLGDLLELL